MAAANGNFTPPRRSTVRCAIYTRKSTEEGLEQEFNTLDAQRDAAEAFIRSQRGDILSRVRSAIIWVLDRSGFSVEISPAYWAVGSWSSSYTYAATFNAHLFSGSTTSIIGKLASSTVSCRAICVGIPAHHIRLRSSAVTDIGL
jgi:hypothetical protein